MKVKKWMFKIAKDFSRTPGPRYKDEGDDTGEELREILSTIVKENIKNEKEMIIDLDGTAGYGTSFLEEVFGGLIREDKIKYSDIKKFITIKSDEEPYLIEDIEEYMEDARNAEE